MADVIDDPRAGGLPPARAASRGRRWLAVVAVVLASAAMTSVLVVRHFSVPPSRVVGLRDDVPDLSKGVSGATLPHTPDTFSLSMGTFLCGKGTVLITSLSLYRPSSGIRLTRWGLQNSDPSENIAGEANGSLDRLGQYDSDVISRQCGSAYYTRVGIQLQRTAPGPQSWLGLRLDYVSDGRQKVGYLWEQYHLR